MFLWKQLIQHIFTNGTHRLDRTGVGTIGVFGASMVFDLHNGFPAVTTKKLPFKSVAAEMACFIHGHQYLEKFHEAGCHFWDDNASDPRWQAVAKDPGDLGRIYGVQWRHWVGTDASNEPRMVDQLQQLADGIKREPMSRRHVVTAWNPAEMDQMCLPPCPLLFQCYVSPDNKLDMIVYQRSCDVFLGLPCDIAGYALLQHLIARECGLTARRLTFFIADAHIYVNHRKQAGTILARSTYHLPQLQLSPDATLFGFTPEQATLHNYSHHDALPAPLNN